MKKALQMKTKNIVMAIAIFLFTISPLAAEGIEKLDILNFAASDSTAVDQSAWYLVDENQSTYWGFKEQSEKGSVEILLKNPALIYAIEMQGELGYDSLLTVEYFKDGLWVPFTMAARRTLGSSATLIDLSYNRIVSEKLRISITGEDLADIQLYEMKLFGEDPKEFFGKIPVSDITESDNTSCFYPEENLTDGNTRTSWYAYHFTGGNEDNRKVKEALRRSNERLEDILGDKDEILQMIRSIRSHLKENKERYIESEIEFAFESPAAIDRMKLFFAEDGQGDVSISLFEDGSWSEMLFIPDGHEYGWKTVELNGMAESVEKVKLSVQGHGFKIGGISEVEFWGENYYTGTHRLPVSNLTYNNESGIANGSFSLQEADERVVEVEIFNARNEQIPIEINGQQFFLTQVSRNDDSTLFACLVPSDYLWQGENFIRVLLPENDQEIYYAHVVAKREYFGKLGFNLSDGFLLTGTTIPLEFEVDLGETLDIVEVHLYQPESPGIRVFARVEENWVELLLKDSCNFRHILEGGIVTDRIRIESLSGQGPGEIQLLGSPTSDTAPEVKILWPKHGDDIGLLEERIGAVIGLVDNPDTEVEINGIEAEKSGHLFWLPLRELEFNTEGICEINTAAIDNKSRIGNHVITVYRGLPAFFTLIPEEDLIYTKTETVLFSGWASPRKYRLLVNGMEAELGWSDFEHSVPVEEGFNQVNFILIDKNKDEVVKVIRKSVVRFSDDLAIDITSPSPGTLLSTDTVIIQGVIKGAGTIEVSVNGETAIVNGSVFSSVPITLAEGVNSIEIEASDSVGNHAVKSINVEMDTIAPVISVLTPKINELIASSEVSVTGEFEDANSVTVFINEVIAHIQGNSFFGSRLFPDGNGVVSVYAIDSAGNRSADVSVPIVVDTTPPLMFDVVSSPDGWTNTMPIINFSTTDAVSGIAGYQISVAGSPFTAAESPFQVPDVDDGTHTVIVKAVDLAGWSTTSSTEIFIDTTPPDAPAEFRAVPGNDIITLKWIETDFDAVSYQITRSPIWDEDLRTVYQLEGNELEFDGETNRHFELSDFELDNGDFISYEIIAIDRAGNVSVSSVIDEAIAGYEKETYTANEGAVVEYENVTLLIGDNSLPENVLEIHITEIESEGLEELSPFPFASPIYQFTVLIETDEGEEHQGHAEFERDFIGVLEYDEEDLIEGWPEQRLGVFYFDRTWSRWIRIEKSAVDVENNKILFSTNHFSEFSVQPTIVEDLSAAELADVEFAPNKTQINHEEVSVSPQGGTVTSSFTELVLPGKNGFDFILKRTYDSATARGDAFGLNINASIGTSDIIVPGADEAVQIASATEIATNILQGIGGGMIAQVENAIKAYFQNNGDYSYSMGQGWRLNLPYIRGANGGILVRLPDGSFHNINKMDVIDSQDIGVGRRIKFENHESADFTLQIVQERISIDVTNIIFKNYLIPSWQLKTATLTLKDGTQYYMDAQGRTTKIVDASGLNEINLEYNLFRLKTIKDSMGRVIHFDYVWKLGYLVPRIDRIWLEDDSPYNREINYTLGRPDKDDVLIDVPLLREAVDVEGRSWKYDYDYHFLFSGHMGMKINPALLIADCFTGGVASAIFGSIFGVDSVTVFGGLRMECVFPLYSAQGPGIGKTLVSYDVKSLDYAEIEGADYFLGICFLPTSVQATINFTKKLVADRLYLYGGDSHNLVRSTSYSYNFMYAGYDQFINYQGTVNDGRLKTIYTYDSDTKKRNRFFTWSDYLASWVNDKIFTSSAYINEIYPYNTDIERRDARTDGLIDRTYLDWDVENMRVTGERIERSGTNYRDTDYVFDNWGNIVKQSNEMRTGERTTKAVTYSYFANTNSSKSNQVPWLTQPFSTGNITEYIHNRLLGSVTVNTLPAAMGQNAPQYIHQYNRYSNSGQKLENALWMNNAWASTQYQYNPEHGSVTEILNPEGHRTTFEYDFEGTGTPWYTVTRTEHDIEGADGSVEDYISITGYEKVSGWPAWKQNPRGFITRNSYDSLGRVTKRIVEGAEGELPVITIIEYNDTAISSTVTLPLGEITVYDYDSLGRLVLIEKRNRTRDSGFQPTDGSFALIETRLKYNGYHEITEITDPNGNSTKYDYNAAGRVLSIIYPEEDGVIPERKMDFDYHSNVETIVDERGNITRDTFDMANKLIMREQELGIETIVTETYFDGLGNETVLVDGNGNVTITSFNEIGKSEHITLPESTFFENGLGKTLSPYFKYEYNQAGHRTGEIASHETGEIRTEYAIDGLGRDIEIKRYLDGSEIVEKIYYDPNGNIVKSIDGNGKLTLFAYTSRDKLETATDAAGNTLEYTYDLRDNRKSMTDPRETSGKYDGDFTILYHYDDLKRVIGAELPEAVAGNGKPVIRFTYDPRGNLLRRMEPDSGETVYSYTKRNFLETETRRGTVSDGSVIEYVTSYNYDEAGNQIAIVDAGNNRTEMRYDAVKRLIQVLRPEGNDEYIKYDNNGNQIEIRNGRGNTIKYSFDPYNRVSTQTDQEGGITSYKYDRLGNLTLYRDALGNETKSYYDELNRLVRELTPLGNESLFEYDAVGNIRQTIDPNGTVNTYEYTDTYLLSRTGMTNTETGKVKVILNEWDEAGDIIRTSDDGIVTEYNTTGTTGGIFTPEQYEPDAYSRVKRMTRYIDGKAYTVDYEYDEMHRITTVVHPSGERIEYEYNTLGQLEKVPGYIDEIMQYNNIGLLESYTAVNGTTGILNYDNSLRLTGLNYDDPLGGEIKHYALGYDRANNINYKNGSLYQYDGNERLVYANERGAFAIDVHEKEATGNWNQTVGTIENDYEGQESITFNGENAEVQFDSASMSIGVDLEAFLKVRSIEIDPEAEIWRVKPKHIEVLTSATNWEDDYQKITDWQYEEEDGKIYLRFRTPVQTRYMKVHCYFDDRGEDGYSVDRATIRGSRDDILTVNYMAGNRVESFEYDLKGNRLSRTVNLETTEDTGYTYYPNSDRIKSDGNWGYLWDANGNLTAKGTNFTDLVDSIEFDLLEGEYRQYEYDLLNRLIEVKKSEAGISELQTIASYTYDSKGYRIKRQDKEGNAEYYIFNLNGQVLYEERLDNTNEYVYVNGKHFARITNGEKFFYLTDHLGSTVMVTSETGEILWQDDYTPFGETTGASGFIDESGRFTGKDFDEDVQLFYSNARWYDPTLGRFITEDPIKDGLNWYVYCSNNPIIYTDPSGLQPLEGSFYLPPVDEGNAEGSTAETDAIANALGGEEQYRIIEVVIHAQNFLQRYGNDHGIDEERFNDLVNRKFKAAIVRMVEATGNEEYIEIAKSINPTDIQDWQNLINIIYEHNKTAINMSMTADLLTQVAIGSLAFVHMYDPTLVNQMPILRDTQKNANGGAAGSTTRVGRWMSETEYQQMLKTGKVQMSGGNMTHVTNPSNANAFNAAKPGSVYVEFNVPANSIVTGGTQGWGIIPGQGSIYDKLSIRQGGSGFTMPTVTNINKVP